MDLKTLTPKEMVTLLDGYIIGQQSAKRAVAIAIRNRYRRKSLPDELRDEVTPKNIIMIGPTGVGKTEIARRLSKITRAPFIKVEATKFTEVGYVGRDVESMIRDLMTVAVNMVKDELRENIQEEAEQRTEESLIDLLLPSRGAPTKIEPATEGKIQENDAREFIRKQLRDGKLDSKQVEVDVHGKSPSIEVFSGANIEEIDFKLGGLGNIFGGASKKKKSTVKNARDILFQQEIEKLIDQDQVADLARERVENNGIIFIDEIDKIANKGGGGGAGPDVSREGVQRDILPIVEGSRVNTKHGMIDTAHILFIAAGAFSTCKPSDLIPELQGRFPIRVELNPLTQEDFVNILTLPQNALITQYIALLSVEGVTLDFSKEAIEYLSQLAVKVNTKTENIGARRLHSVLEQLLEEVSFSADELHGQIIRITVPYVKERLDKIVEDHDLSYYIL